MLLELLTDPTVWASFFALCVLEIILGIDNVVFIAVVAESLPQNQRARARQLGLAGALIFRLALLWSIAWVVGLTAPVLTVYEFTLSWRDIVLLLGGAFLLWKSCLEIHNEVTRGHAPKEVRRGSGAFVAVVGQIVLIDVVFSVDSVIMAVGLAEHVEVMMAAVVVAVIFMVWTAGPISRFIRANPTTRMLALAFLVVIGAALVADGFHIHFDREPIYAAMAFATLVEGLNLLRDRRHRKRQARKDAGA